MKTRIVQISPQRIAQVAAGVYFAISLPLVMLLLATPTQAMSAFVHGAMACALIAFLMLLLGAGAVSLGKKLMSKRQVIESKHSTSPF